MIVFINGSFCDEHTAHVATTDRGLTLGDGVFDTMLAVDGMLQDTTAHYERLARHAAVIGIDVDTSGFHELAQDLLRQNDFVAGPYAVRTTVTRGSSLRGLALPENPIPTIIMRASPALPSPATMRVIIARSVRRNEGSPLSRIKSLNYGDNIAAWREAAAAGADDAIIMNNAENAACATASNIFIRIGDHWLTPPLRDGAMDGITRARLLVEKSAREETITAAMLSQAAEILLTSSVAGIRQAQMLTG